MSFYAEAIGAIADTATSLFSGKKQHEAQEEFAKKGIRWRVADAKAAGLHPLAALGAAGASYSPVVTHSDFSGLGQSVDRAMEATRTAPERAEAAGYRVKAAQLQLENMELQNELLRSDIARRNAQIGPPMPDAATAYPVYSGDVNMTHLMGDSVGSGTVRTVPSEITSKSPVAPYKEAGTAAGGKDYDFGPLGTWTLLSSGASESLEDLDLAKYAALIGMNLPPGTIEKLVAQSTNPADALKMFQLAQKRAVHAIHDLTVPKPKWVLEMQRRSGKLFKPVYKDGITYWRPED